MTCHHCGSSGNVYALSLSEAALMLECRSCGSIWEARKEEVRHEKFWWQTTVVEPERVH